MSDPVRYHLSELRKFRDAIGSALDTMEAQPYDGGAYEVKTDLREKGLSVHLKWNPKLPILAPSEPPHTCVMNLADLGMNPTLMWQLLGQLIELMEDEEKD